MISTKKQRKVEREPLQKCVKIIANRSNQMINICARLFTQYCYLCIVYTWCQCFVYVIVYNGKSRHPKETWPLQTQGTSNIQKLPCIPNFLKRLEWITQTIFYFISVCIYSILNGGGHTHFGFVHIVWTYAHFRHFNKLL